MPDIFHDFIIKAPVSQVFDGISSPAGLDSWWTQRSSGIPKAGNEYMLDFGPGYEWKAKVTKCVKDKAFELLLTDAQEDWRGTSVGFELEHHKHGCLARFCHRGWSEENDHYRTSCYCWAMYLRILKRKIEYGEDVPYVQRLEV